MEFTIPKSNEPDFDRDRKLYFSAFPGVKTFQTFDDLEPKRKSMARQCHCREVPVRMLLSLEKGNNMKAGIHMTVNETDGKGRSVNNIKRVRAVVADLDGAPLEPVLKYKPSIIIETSPERYHCYWLTDDTPLEAFRILQESIAIILKSDPQVKDLSRCLRVPGFYHYKAEPFLVRLIHFFPAQHSFGRLVEMFPPPQRPQFSADRYQKKYKSNGEFKGSYGSSEGSRNADMCKIIGGMLKDGRGWEYIKSECYKHNEYSNPPLPPSEVNNILRSCRKYAG